MTTGPLLVGALGGHWRQAQLYTTSFQNDLWIVQIQWIAALLRSSKIHLLDPYYRFCVSSRCHLSSTSTSSSSSPTTTSPIVSAPSCWTTSLSGWKLVGCWTSDGWGAPAWKRWRKVKASRRSTACLMEQGPQGYGTTWTSSTESRPSSPTSCSAPLTTKPWVVFFIGWTSRCKTWVFQLFPQSSGIFN